MIVASALFAGLGVGCGDAETDHLIKHVEVATRGGEFRGVVDATPGPDGRTTYFTATGPEGPGVFRVPATGGSATVVVTGPPFEKPVGIAVSTDGGRLFVADTQAGGGAVFSVASSGGRPDPVAGTERTAPRGIDVVRAGGQDVLFFAGRDRNDGSPGVFRVPTGGGAPTPVAKGSPLVSPDAVTVTKAGVVFVTDRGSAGGRGAVYRVVGSTPERIAELRAPNLAGLALTRDESTLLVSALSEAGTDQVLVIDVPTLRSRVFSKMIGENREGGGLHRAHDVDVFAWADFVAGPDRQGRVYTLRP